MAEADSLSESLKALSESTIRERTKTAGERFPSAFVAPTDEPPSIDGVAKFKPDERPPEPVVVPAEEEAAVAPEPAPEADSDILPAIPQAGGTGVIFLPPSPTIGEGGIEHSPWFVTPDMRRTLSNVRQSADPMFTQDMVASGMRPGDSARITPDEFKRAKDPSWYETIFHWLEPFDWPRRAAWQASYWMGDFLPDPTEQGEESTFVSSIGDVAQRYVGIQVRNALESTESFGGLAKFVTTAPIAPLALAWDPEETSPYEEIGESLYKAIATGELYKKGTLRRGMAWADGEGGGIPFIDVVGEKGFSAPFPMGVDVLDSTIPQDRAAELAQSTSSPVNKVLFNMLSSYWGREGVGVLMEIAADPLWFAGPAGGSKTVAKGDKVYTISRQMVRTAGTIARLKGDDASVAERMLVTLLTADKASDEFKTAQRYVDSADMLAAERAQDSRKSLDRLKTDALDPSKALDTARRAAEKEKRYVEELIEDWGKSENARGALPGAKASLERVTKELDMFSAGKATATPETAAQYLRQQAKFSAAEVKVYSRDRDLIQATKNMINDGLAGGVIKEKGRFSVHIPFGKETHYLSDGTKRAVQYAIPQPMIDMVGSSVSWMKAPDMKKIYEKVRFHSPTEMQSVLSKAELFAVSAHEFSTKAMAPALLVYKMLADAFGTRMLQPALAKLRTTAQLSSSGVGGLGNAFARVPVLGGKYIAIRRVAPEVWENYQTAYTNYMRKVVSLEDNLLQHEKRIVLEAKKVHQARKQQAEAGIKKATMEQASALKAVESGIARGLSETELLSARTRYFDAKEQVDKFNFWKSEEYGPLHVIFDAHDALERGAVYAAENRGLMKLAPTIQALVQDFATNTETERERVITALVNMAAAMEGDVAKSRMIEEGIEELSKKIADIDKWKVDRRSAIQAIASDYRIRINTFKRLIDNINTDKLARALERIRVGVDGKPYDEAIHGAFIVNVLNDVLVDPRVVESVLTVSTGILKVESGPEAVLNLANKLGRKLKVGEPKAGEVLVKSIDALMGSYAESLELAEKAMSVDLGNEGSLAWLSRFLGEEFGTALERTRTAVGDELWPHFSKYMEDHPNLKDAADPARGWVKAFLDTLPEEVKEKLHRVEAPKPKRKRKPKIDAPLPRGVVGNALVGMRQSLVDAGLSSSSYTMAARHTEERTKLLNKLGVSYEQSKLFKEELARALKADKVPAEIVVYRGRTEKQPPRPPPSHGYEYDIVNLTKQGAEVRSPRGVDEGWVVDEFVIKRSQILGPGDSALSEVVLKRRDLQKARAPKPPPAVPIEPVVPPVPPINIRSYASKLGGARKNYWRAHGLAAAAQDKYSQYLKLTMAAPARAGIRAKGPKLGVFAKQNLIAKRLGDAIAGAETEADAAATLKTAIREIVVGSEPKIGAPFDPQVLGAISPQQALRTDPILDDLINSFVQRVIPTVFQRPSMVTKMATPTQEAAASLASKMLKTFDPEVRGAVSWSDQIPLLADVPPPKPGPAYSIGVTPQEAVRLAKSESRERLKVMKASLTEEVKNLKGRVDEHAGRLKGIYEERIKKLNVELEELTPRIPTPDDRKAGTRVLEKWEQDLWLEFSNSPTIKGLNEEERTYAAFLALRDMPDLPNKNQELYDKLVKDYRLVLGRRFDDMEADLKPVIREVQDLITSYEKLYEEHGLDFMKKPYDMLKDWGVVEYVPHIANSADLIALGKSASVVDAVGQGAERARVLGGVNSLDARLSTAMDARKSRKIDGTIREINAITASKDGGLTLTLDPMAVIARYMQANRAMTSQEMMLYMLRSGVIRAVRSDETMSATNKALAEDLVPIFDRPNVGRDLDLLMNGGLEDIARSPNGVISKEEALNIQKLLKEWAVGHRGGKKLKDISPFATWIREVPELQQGVNVEEAIMSLRMKQIGLGEAALFNATERAADLRRGITTPDNQLRIDKAVEKAKKSAERRSKNWVQRDQAAIHVSTKMDEAKEAEVWNIVAQELRTNLYDRGLTDIKAVSGRMLSTFFAEGNEVWRLYVPKAVAQSMYDTLELDRLGAGTIPKRVLDKINSFWKTRLTIISTAFTVRNAISNVMTNILDLGPFGALNPATNFNASRLAVALQYAESHGSLVRAREALRAPRQAGETAWDHKLRQRSAVMFKVVDDLIESGIDLGDGLIRSADDAIKILKENGVASGAYTQVVDINRAEQGLAELMVHGGLEKKIEGAKQLLSRAEDLIIFTLPMAMTGTVWPVAISKKLGAEVARVTENQARISNFIGNMRRSGNIKEAANHANKFLFNYSDLTATQKIWMRTLFPFFTWNQKNLHLQLEMMRRSPVFYSQFSRLLVTGLPNVIEAVNDENYIRQPVVTKQQLRIRMPHTLSLVRVPIPKQFGAPEGAHIEGLGLPIEGFVEMMSIIGSTTDVNRTYDTLFGAGQALEQKPFLRMLGHMHFMGRYGFEAFLSGHHSYYDRPIKELTNGRLVGQALTGVARFSPELASLAANSMGVVAASEMSYDGALGPKVYVNGGWNHLFGNVPWSRFIRDAAALTDAYRVSLAASFKDMEAGDYQKIPKIFNILDAMTGVRLVQQKEDMERRVYKSRMRKAIESHHQDLGYTYGIEIQQIPDKR